MTKYVTLDDLKQQMNIDFDNDDDNIEKLIIPVQLSVQSYLNAPLESFVKDGRIDGRIWHTIRIIVANMYANRESVAFAQAYVIPDQLAFLIQPLKRYE